MRRWLFVAIGAFVTVGAVGFLTFRAGYVRLTNPDTTRYPIRGLDVSRHQGDIDWSMVATEGGQAFAYIKATEGRDHTDVRFRANWRDAKNAGIVRGAYHFFTFCSPGRAQAEHFLEIVGRSRGELPLAVDVEFKGNCKRWKSIGVIRAELARFLRLVDQADGRQPVIYTTSDAYDRLLKGHFRRLRLWIRSIISEPPSERYPGWVVWQYAGNGRVQGVSTLVDLNVFRGSQSRFRDFTQSSDG